MEEVRYVIVFVMSLPIEVLLIEGRHRKYQYVQAAPVPLLVKPRSARSAHFPFL